MSEVIKMHLQDGVNVGGGGGGSDAIWLPNVSEEGVISWSKSTSTTAPTARNIKGADGADGQDGADGVGIDTVYIDANNHLIVTKTDGTSEDAGEIQGGGESSDIPSYYQTEFATTKASVESHSTNDSYNVLFMTDLHFSSKGSGYNEDRLRDPLFKTIKAAKKFVAEVPVNQFVLNGDYMQMPENFTKEMGISNIAELNEMFDGISVPFMPLEGNHEADYRTGNPSAGNGLTADEVYQLLSKKWVGKNGIKKVSINTYYRIDDVNEVCHVFVSTFTTGAMKTAILADFASVVSANTNDYPYIIYNHFGNTPTDVETQTKDSIDYIKNTLGKTIIAWISGHKHFDWVRVYNNTLVITLLNSGFWTNEQGQDEQTYTKTTGTASESAFSVLTIVPSTGKLFVTRFGAGVDFECNYNTTSGAIGRIGYLPTTSYSVTNTLSGGVSTSNASGTATGGDSYDATLSVPDNHYTFGTVTVTMGGTDITSTAYDSTTHEVSIASVNGDIVITATATNDYFFTALESEAIQYSSGKPATFTVSGNNLSLEIPQANSGVKLKLDPIKAAVSEDTNFKMKIDSGSASVKASGVSVRLQYYDSSNTQLQSVEYWTSSGTIDAIESGISKQTTAASVANAAYVVLEIRSSSSASGIFPYTLTLNNLRIEYPA
ncbi:MAG: metallophosphoesterase [Lachnospiraceae bacterium]|nr:metallophosphoesterase [Lachnospiraceae bacterium]